MKFLLVGLITAVGVALGVGACGPADGANTVSSETNDSEIRLLTETVNTNSGVVTCVVAVNTRDYAAPGLSCNWPNDEGL